MVLHFFEPGGHVHARAVQFDDQDGARTGRVVATDALFGGGDGERVHDLERGGDQPGGDDRGHGGASAVDVGKGGQDRLHTLGSPH